MEKIGNEYFWTLLVHTVYIFQLFQLFQLFCLHLFSCLFTFQVFGPKVILPSWKNLLCRPKAPSTNTLGSVYRKRRHSIPAEELGPTSNNANGGSQV